MKKSEITIAGKAVTLCYCYATEIAFKTLAERDINDFMLKYAEAADYDSWKQAFDKAVVYKKMATTWDTDKKWVYYSRFTMKDEKFGGVSMYVPTLSQQNTQNKDIKQMGWYYAAGYNEIGW